MTKAREDLMVSDWDEQKQVPNYVRRYTRQFFRLQNLVVYPVSMLLADDEGGVTSTSTKQVTYQSMLFVQDTFLQLLMPSKCYFPPPPPSISVFPFQREKKIFFLHSYFLYCSYILYVPATLSASLMLP